MTYKTYRQLGILGLLALLLPACMDKKCQKPPEQSFKSITEAEWRLVETTDPNPNFKKLNNTTFFIFSFQKNYTGAVNNVINNDKYDTPVRTFKYNISPDENLIRVKYEMVAPEGEEGAAPVEDNTPPIDYSYELGRELELINLKSGALYRFVPFTGIVDPDNTCSF